MSTLCRAVVMLGALGVATVPLSAQGTAVAPDSGGDRLVLGAVEVRATRPDFGATVAAADALGGELAAGGRYGLLWDRVIDRVGGWEARYTWPGISSVVLADPARARGFFTRGNPSTLDIDGVVMGDLRTGVVTPLVDLPPGASGFGRLARYAVDAERLVVMRVRDAMLGPEWVEVNLAGGPPSSRVLPLPAVPTWPASYEWTLSPDGARLYLLESSGVPVVASVVAYDTATGAEVARTAAIQALSFTGTIEWNIALDGLLVMSQPGAAVRYTLLTRDLQVVGAAVFDSWGKCGPTDVAVSPVTGRVYSFTGGGNYYGVPFFSRLAAVPLGGGSEDLADVETGAKVNCGRLKVLSPPGPPRRFQAAVAGRTASFRWENVGSASQFVLDVGVAPGRTDLSIPLGPASQWVTGGVPPGTYYVRVRGTNLFGDGGPSAEIRVVVP